MMERLPGLSASARQLIDRARGFDEPNAADASRVRDKWLSAVAMGASSSVAGSTAQQAGGSTAQQAGSTTQQATGNALASKGVAGKAAFTGSQWALWSGAGLAVLGIGAGVWSFSSDPALPSSSTAQAPQASRLSLEDFRSTPNEAAAPQGTSPLEDLRRPAPAPEPSPSEAPSRPELVDLPSEADPSPAEAQPPQRSAPASRSARPPVTPASGMKDRKDRSAPVQAEPAQPEEPKPAASLATPGQALAAAPKVESTLRQEIELLKTARELLGRGQSRAALGVLDQYARRFPQAVLAAEASALRVDALCSGGQRKAARVEAAQFLQRWATSPLAQRVADTCAK